MMPLTSSEKQKRYRARLKKKRENAPDVIDALRTGDFAKFLEDDPNHVLSFIRETLDSVGLYEQTALETDADPYWREEWGTPNRGALGRAERMVGALIDSAKALAELINAYKVQEIDAAIARLESKKFKTMQEQKAALRESVRLAAIRKQLNREVRHGFRQFTVKEEEPKF